MRKNISMIDVWVFRFGSALLVVAGCFFELPRSPNICAGLNVGCGMVHLISALMHVLLIFAIISVDAGDGFSLQNRPFDLCHLFG